MRNSVLQYLPLLIAALILIALATGPASARKERDGKSTAVGHAIRSAAAVQSAGPLKKEKPFLGPFKWHRAKADSRTFAKGWSGCTSCVSFDLPLRHFATVAFQPLPDSPPCESSFFPSSELRGPPAA